MISPLGGLLLGALAQSEPAGVSWSAWSAAVPPECLALSSQREGSWQRLRQPELRRYCLHIARGTAHLSGLRRAPSEALSEAERADRMLANHAATDVLRARAFLAEGDAPRALELLERAFKKEPRARDDVHSMLAYGLALSRIGKRDQAAALFRILLPRSSVLTSGERTEALLHAGFLALELGPSRLSEATTAFRQASLEAGGVRYFIVLAALATCIDRAGMPRSVRDVVLARVGEEGRQLLALPLSEPVLRSMVGDEIWALRAITSEAHDPKISHSHWQTYAATKSTAWKQHAKVRASELSLKGAVRPR